MATRELRKIVIIEDEKCDGCGLCIPKCAEGAIQIIGGKARLVAENLCDGLGNCLGTCPRGAIRVEEREADAFDEAAVEAHLASPRPAAQPGAAAETAATQAPSFCGCPGAAARTLSRAAEAQEAPTPAPAGRSASPDDTGDGPMPPARSELRHWPVQIALLPPQGDLWREADVLIAADCVGFAMPDLHARLMRGKTVAVGCPKLDDLEAYVQKLAAVFARNAVRSVTVARMEVPCCAGLVTAVLRALAAAGREDLPLREVTVGIEGVIVSDVHQEKPATREPAPTPGAHDTHA